MKTKILYLILFVCLLIFLPNFCMAKDSNIIEEYNLTVNPRNNGSLDLIYDIKWQVLNTGKIGYLNWIEIPISNSHVSNIEALSDNIRNIMYYNEYGDSIKIDFTEEYYEGDVIEFKFSINQSYMYNIDGDKCIFEYEPEFFNNISIKKLNITWNNQNVFSSNSKEKDTNDNLVWKASIRKGKSLKIKVVYVKNVFNLDYNMQFSNAKVTNRINQKYTIQYVDIIKEILIFIICINVLYVFLGLDYKLHSGIGI